MIYNGSNYRNPINTYDDCGEQPDIRKGPPQWIDTKKYWKVGVEQVLSLENDFEYLSDAVLFQAKDYGVRQYGQSSFKTNVNERIILPDNLSMHYYRYPLHKQPIANVRPDKEYGQLPDGLFDYNIYNKKVASDIRNKVVSGDNQKLRQWRPDGEIKVTNEDMLKYIDSLPLYVGNEQP